MGVKMKPMFKWSGGKRRELQHVQELTPDKFSNYCEPFVGGGAVLFSLSHDSNFVGDTNADVINFYNVVKAHGKTFIDDLNSFGSNYKQTIDSLKPKMREELQATS
jgi:DNA adenine methylase